ncbi:MAG TPA: phosphoribosylanthranilate isomerase [Thermomicrobiales bacterium]|nr:phosphoribosylanthranilate isomerase [Thermomicrobiales bacterium]
MTQVKICGISDPRHAVVAAEAGADFAGVVFYPPSSRYVTVQQAREVVASLAGMSTRLVGLFVNETPETINRVADAVGLDLVQLSGAELPPDTVGIERPVIATVRADSSGRADEERRFSEWTTGATQPFAIMLDAHVPGMYGGTGAVADWFVAADFARRYPVFLAGGLTPATVGEAIRRVHPFAVDVSSGVETDGRKDEDKIRAFVAAARLADADPISTTPIDVPVVRGR